MNGALASPPRPGRMVLDEWRLQWRSWGTPLIALVSLLVIVTQHPAVEAGAGNFSPLAAAANWADRAALIGALLMILTVPFSLDRVRRAQVAAVEMSKPFSEPAYALAKLAGASLPGLLALLASGIAHLAITWAVAPGAGPGIALAYLDGAAVIVLSPVLFAAAVTFCLSVFTRPLYIVPLYLAYLTSTALTGQVAGVIRWVAPLVRPDYFPGYMIPDALRPQVLLHAALYLALAALAVGIAAAGFRRQRFLDEPVPLWPRLQRLVPQVSAPQAVRMLWGAPAVAALALAALTPSMSLGPVPEGALAGRLRVDQAYLALEFYLSLSGLLLLAGALARDAGFHALELVLSKPVNRWRLLARRLLPPLALFAALVVLLVGYIHLFYTPLPVLKALLVALSTGVYLGMVGMTAANLTRSAVAGYGFGLLYWLLEAGFQGRWTAPVFLLIASHQPQASDFWRFNETVWLPNKLALLALAVWLFALNGWMLDHSPARRRALGLALLSLPLVCLLGWYLLPRLLG